MYTDACLRDDVLLHGGIYLYGTGPKRVPFSPRWSWVPTLEDLRDPPETSGPDLGDLRTSGDPRAPRDLVRELGQKTSTSPYSEDVRRGRYLFSLS